MRISLNHTIVNASDRHASAVFLADLLGLEPPTTYGPFSVVQVGDTSLDFAHDHAAPRGLQPQHYAFLVSEADFDATWERIRSRGLPALLGRPVPTERGHQPQRRWPRALLAGP